MGDGMQSLDWTPPQYKWLFDTNVNGLHFYEIFDTREAAVEWADRQRDIDPSLWFEDASGNLHYYPEDDEYHYWITQEIYHA